MPSEAKCQPQQQRTEDDRVQSNQPHQCEQPYCRHGDEQNAEEHREGAIEPQETLALDRSAQTDGRDDLQSTPDD